ncbi:hypothetical protein PMAYCL1PPCAC_05214 [Pristionchus mayeri]|uniref:Uncharacterized protein n=1 Tax=Pristionchus mayeri TaxID=1317129 RepID=A0AAN4Z7X9_9BILA|nr:hypothetical protein PMAYCL1PPCAC_05214 [Pristionchus mayeri]
MVMGRTCQNPAMNTRLVFTCPAMTTIQALGTPAITKTTIEMIACNTTTGAWEFTVVGNVQDRETLERTTGANAQFGCLNDT